MIVFCKRQGIFSLHPSGGNTLPVGAREERSGGVGLYGRPPSPFRMESRYFLS
jgi:hypothetical protein